MPMSLCRIERCVNSFVLFGLSAPDPAQITAGMPVKGLVIVSDYNPRSRLLPRAHELAAKLERPLHLWQPADGEFLIPVPERCVRMGLVFCFINY